jgi:uncharacterized protein YcnI
MRTLWTAAALLSIGSLAEAHVTVSPEESRGGAVERYTVRVPTEGQVTTIAVDLEVPQDVTITGIIVNGGFAYEARREGNRIIGITWKLDIKPGEVAEFAFFARNPTAGQLTWKAHQRFADGTSADWTGVEGDRRPAAVTKITPSRQR